MGDYADLLNVQQSTPQPRTPRKRLSGLGATGSPPDQPVARSGDQSTSQATTRATSRMVGRSGNAIVPRPKAFYITQRLDQCLDAAVRYFQEQHGIVKVDRSTIVNAVLDNEAQWTEEALDLMVDRVISQLTSRLTGK